MQIIWNDQYVVDGGRIDEDHRTLFRFYNHLEASAADGVAFITGLQRFRDACEIHFRRKERLLHAVRYPQVEDHRQRHANLLMRLEDIAARTLPLGDPLAAAPLLNDLRVWLLDHIAKHDMELKPFAAALRQAAQSPRNWGFENI